MKKILVIGILAINMSCSGMLQTEEQRKKSSIAARAHVIKSQLQSRERKIAQELKLGEFQDQTQKPKNEQVVWVQTGDGDIKPIDKWKIEQMRALHLLLLHQRDKNSKDEPINASNITSSWSLQLLSHAFDALANGTLDDYYTNLKEEYDETLKSKIFGEGRLRLLIAASEKIQATTLSVLLAHKMLPKELQNRVIPKEFLEPVCTYLKAELLKKAKKELMGRVDIDSHRYADFNEGFSQLLIGSHRGTLKLIDIKSWKQTDLIGHSPQSKIDFVSFNKSGSRAISCDNEENVILWDIINKRQIATIVQDGYYAAAVFSKEGSHVIAASGQDLKIFNSIDGKEVNTIHSIHGEKIVSVSCHPNGEHVISGGAQGSRHNVVLCNIATGQSKSLNSSQEEALVAFSQSGKRIVYAFNNKVVLNEFNSDSEFINVVNEKVFEDSFNPIMITFSPDEQYYVLLAKEDFYSMLFANKCINNSAAEPFWMQGLLEGIVFILHSPLYIVKTVTDALYVNEIVGKTDYRLSEDKGPQLMMSRLGKEPSKQDLFIDKTGNNMFVVYGKKIEKWQLFEKQDLQTLNDIENKLDVAQSQLLYQMYLAKLHGSFVEGFIAGEIFSTLPRNVKDMALMYLMTKPFVPEKTSLFGRARNYLSSFWK